MENIQKEINPGRPNLGDLAKIYVPIKRSYGIMDGSGIVGYIRSPDAGEPIDESSIMAYYEGNSVGASNLVNWVDKVRHAYGRMAQSAPTIAKSLVDATDFVEVGFIDGNHIQVTNRKALQQYLAASGHENTIPLEDVTTQPKREDRRVGTYRPL